MQGIGYHRARQESLKEAPFTIRKVDLGAMGNWYRIFAGVSRNQEEIRSMGTNLSASRPYARIMEIDGRPGIHMASYRTEAEALRGIQRLKSDYPALADQNFTTHTVDLGPEKGTWHRVVATGFGTRAQAESLAGSLKPRQAYSTPMAMETAGELTVHTASYRTMDKALAHLRSLARRMGEETPDQIAVRPVDLGGKGKWYRVVLGEFGRAENASDLVSALRASGEYARVVPLGESM